QDIRHANYHLGTAVPYFPRGTIHVAVVDPGVGSERKPLLIQTGGQLLVGPDNGIFTRAVKSLGEPVQIYKLSEPRFWLPTVSATFHGRDVFAPVAAHLSLGSSPAAMGQIVEEMVELEARSAVCWKNQCIGEVQFVDGFGNLITNIPSSAISSLPVRV